MHPIPLSLIFVADFAWALAYQQADVIDNLNRDSGYEWDGERVLEGDHPVAVTRRRNTDWVVLHYHDVPVSRIAKHFAV